MAARIRAGRYRELSRCIELDGPQRACQLVGQMLESGDCQPESFSLRNLFESTVEDGHRLVNEMNPANQGNGFNFLEANSAVDTSAFSNITGQIVYTKMLEAFQAANKIGELICPTMPTTLNGERIPGIGGLGDKAEVVGEGQLYPTVGLSEDYIDTPVTTKRGMIVPVTKEAVFFDRTGLVLRRAAEVGEYLGVNKEKRQIDIATGVTNNYKWKGTAYNTYQTTSPWINDKTSNALVDWTDVEALELLFDALTDPNTGEPIVLSQVDVIVPSALKHTANRVFLPHDVRFGDGASSSTAVYQPNPLTMGGKSYNVITSPLVKSRTSSATKWFFGDFKKAFAYMENFPLTVVQAPANSEDDFKRDIVAQFKASERGVAAVLEPRAVCRSDQ